jgi:Ca-activated chloride channel family protein
MGATIRFDTRNLEKIAAITGGRFFRAKDNQGFEDVMNTIDSLEKTSKQRPALIYQRDLYPNLLKAGLIALTVGFLLRYTLLREIS